MPDARQVVADLQLREQLIRGLEELNKRLPPPGSQEDIGDIHHPRVPPYFHQEFPQMLHHATEKDVDVKIARDADEEYQLSHSNYLPENENQIHFPKKLRREQPKTVIVHDAKEREEYFALGFATTPPPPHWAVPQADGDSTEIEPAQSNRRKRA